MFHECLGVVNAVPGEQGVCLGCLGVVFYCLGVFWGLLEGVSVLSEVSGSAFYSNLIYINCALIKSLTFSKRRGGPRCLKYQNVPTSRSFWPIGNPWERFQSWDIRVYFIPVPDDHTVITLTWLFIMVIIITICLIIRTIKLSKRIMISFSTALICFRAFWFICFPALSGWFEYKKELSHIFLRFQICPCRIRRGFSVQGRNEKILLERIFQYFLLFHY